LLLLLLLSCHLAHSIPVIQSVVLSERIHRTDHHLSLIKIKRKRSWWLSRQKKGPEKEKHTHARIKIMLFRMACLSALFMLLVLVTLLSISPLVLMVQNKQQDEQQQEAETLQEAAAAAAAAAAESADSLHRSRYLAGKNPQLSELRRRYESYPPGFRVHPSYLSETYLPRSKVMEETEKRTALTEKWGSWTLVDKKLWNRPVDDFYAKYPHRDVPYADFPADLAWQKDKKYVWQFLTQATDLTRRTMEAILAEYGRPRPTSDANANNAVVGADEKEADFQNRAKLLMADLVDYSPTAAPTPADPDVTRHLKGTPLNAAGGWIAKKSWSGLKRRLLHAVMSQDSFNLVMGGHSAAAGKCSVTTIFLVVAVVVENGGENGDFVCSSFGTNEKMPLFSSPCPFFGTRDNESHLFFLHWLASFVVDQKGHGNHFQ
jgi:hypothetical protein